MAIAVVQQDTDSVIAATQAFSLAGVGAGNALFMLFSTYQGLGADTVSDGVNTWARAIAEDDGGNNQCAIWRALNVASGSVTVTAGATGGAAVSGVLVEVSGLATVGADDKTASALSPSTTSVVSGTTATTTTANEILFAVMTHDGTTPSITEEGGWTLLFEQENNNDRQCGSFVYRIVSATGTYGTTWTIGSAVNGVGAIATFADTGGGGGGGNPWYYYAQQRMRVDRLWKRRGLLWEPSYALRAA